MSTWFTDAQFEFSKFGNIPCATDLYCRRIQCSLINNEYPIIVLDIGGMLGKSWLQLARKFEKQIVQSKVALVVSNLSFNPEKDLQKFEQFTRSYQDLYNIYHQCIHYVNGSVSDLRRASITLPNGMRIPLRGNTAIINECFSLTHWSDIPELEFLQAVSLLNKAGLYNIQERGDSIVAYDYPETNVNRLLNTYNLAMQRDLVQVENIEAGSYKSVPFFHNRVFRRSSAPLINLD